MTAQPWRIESDKVKEKESEGKDKVSMLEEEGYCNFQ